MISIDYVKSSASTFLSTLDEELNHLQSQSKNITDEIESLQRQLEEVAPSPYKLKTPRIYLDVGGIHYTTTLSTLTSVPDSLIGNMFSGRYPLKLTEDGRVFIDRDGTHFGYILRFLRDPENTVIKIRDPVDYFEFKVEVAYYGLNKAMFGDVDMNIPEVLNWLDNKDVFVASFSSQQSGFPASNTLNPSVTFWLSESGLVTDQWIVYEFKSVCYINKLAITVDGYTCSVKDFEVQVNHNDDPTADDWETVMEFTAQSGTTTTTEQTFQGFELRAKCVRLFFKNNHGNGGGAYIMVKNVRFHGGHLEEVF